jgi:hypothetical protein
MQNKWQQQRQQRSKVSRVAATGGQDFAGKLM